MSETGGRMTRRSKAAQQHSSPHTPSEEVDMDSSLNMPHMPMHVHMESSSSSSTQDGINDKSMGLEGDRYNVALLTFLYVLQGIPLGLAGSVPYLLQSRKVNYKDQAMFSFVYWPFSIKLLWAPIVDSVYVARFGRRKSWLVPIQYLIGLFMLILSSHVSELLGEGGDKKGEVNILVITITFFMLNFLAATQDIAVDGWALTMLQRRNVGWASTCNTVGQTAGYFMGHVVFMALESANFCNKYLRSEPTEQGIVTLGGFLYMWGIVFMVTTSLVMVLKRENGSSNGTNNMEVTSQQDTEDMDQGIVDTYKQLFNIVRLPSVLSLISILLTVKVGFAAADAITGLKLIEEGVPRDSLALLGIPMVPIQIILPIFITRYTTGPRPMDIFLKAMPYRLLMGLEFALIVWWAPSTRTASGEYPAYFYMVVLLSYALHQVALYSMFVSMMAFFAKISDPAIGGTYMTLLNTIANFGGNWPATVALWLVDSVTWKHCEGAKDNVTAACGTHDQDKVCTDAGGTCVITFDGYYLLSIVCVIIGLLWIRLRSRRVRQLQDLGPQEWTCS